MRKYFFNILFFSICCFNSFSQHDSLYPDSLKRVLPALKDSARVDCLKTISENSQYWRGSFMPEDYRRTSDSMFKYASLAYEEAGRIHYKYGLVTALLNLSGSYGNKPLTPDSIYNQAARAALTSKYGNEALKIAKETDNNALLGKVYYSGIGEGKDYMENWKTSLYYYGKAGDVDNKFRVMVDLVTDLEFNIYGEERLLYADCCLQLAKEFVPVTPLDQGSQKLIVSTPIKEIEEVLEDHFFVLAHRSYLVNLNEVEKYVKGEGGYLIMSDGSSVDVSRSKKELLLKKLLPHKQ